ncbi:MAG: Spy/CpxP family protein refolding chaperone [Thermodesulfobacteriota bacterium]
MIWNRLKKPLLVLSVSLNAAFIAFWLTQAMSGLSIKHKAAENQSGKSMGLSALHQEIGVTPEQWKRIEPHALHFRKETEAQLRILGGLHGQLMELLAAPDLDESAIREKQAEILAGQRRMQDLVFDLLLQEKDILTLAQRRELLQAIHQSCAVAKQSCSHENGPAQREEQ